MPKRTIQTYKKSSASTWNKIKAFKQMRNK